MREFLDAARTKINEEKDKYKGDKYGAAMKDAVADSLLLLCELEPEFAQAVAQGGPFSGCMDAVRKKVSGNSLSDIDAYCEAAAYFFPGCHVRMNLEINLCGDADKDAFVGRTTEATAGKQTGIVINLMDLL